MIFNPGGTPASSGVPPSLGDLKKARQAAAPTKFYAIRVLKTKHQAVSQGVRHFGKRSLLAIM
ncbi:MAG: hypothetical protein HY895_02080 [Deltaproteobacteria bacterium]|nr:hypothetical protein [Deltaproteobacteria bacterium]